MLEMDIKMQTAHSNKQKIPVNAAFTAAGSCTESYCFLYVEKEGNKCAFLVVSFLRLMSILNFFLQQQWWSAVLPKSPGKCGVIEGGFIVEHNKARQKRHFLFPSRFHERRVIAEKDADKGGTLEPWAGITVDRPEYV